MSGEQKQTTRSSATARRTTARKAARKAARTVATATGNGAVKANGATRAAATATAVAAARAAAKAATNGHGSLNGATPMADVVNPPRIERRRSKINGWGVFALDAIPKNKRIIYYAGERISAKDSGPREEKYLSKGHIWCFQVNRRWVVDAAVGGNVARFINHACRPNCYTHIVDGVIWVRAGRPIRKGEELTYNYYTEGQAEIPCRCVPGCQGML